MGKSVWMEENKKWFVPTLVGSIMMLIFVSVAIGFIYVLGVVKTSKIYVISVEKARKNPKVRRVLGKNIKGGLFVEGTISVSHLSGEADFVIPISGSEGKGRLRVLAQKVDDQWIYAALEVEADKSVEVIDLLEDH